jgi:hypothetical protein
MMKVGAGSTPPCGNREFQGQKPVWRGAGDGDHRNLRGLPNMPRLPSIVWFPVAASLYDAPGNLWCRIVGT